MWGSNMAGLRRAPKEPQKGKPKVKPLPPLHQRILGKSGLELDTIHDLRIELESALEHDLVEYDDYLVYHETLDIREAKAKAAILKASGRYVKPDKTVEIRVRPVSHKPMARWKVKLLCVAAFLIFIKFFGFKA